MSGKTLQDYNPFDPETLICPYNFNRQLRNQEPVYHCPHTGVYFISTFDLVVEVTKNDSLYSNRFDMIQAGVSKTAADPELTKIRSKGYPPVNTMLTQDPPEQRRYRDLCRKPFSVASVAKLQPYLTDLSHELIDSFIDEGKCNWMQTFAVPLPVRMIAYILGVPLSDMNLFKRWSDSNIYQFSAGQTPEGLRVAAQDVVDFQHYFAEKIQQRQRKPTDDVLSDIVNSSVDGERPMTVAECLSVLAQLLVAGNETTTATFAEGLHLLATHPEQLKIVQQDLALVPNMVEEMLRLSAPTSQMWRVAKQDSVLNGVKIPAGSTLMIKFSSANRDEMQFLQADKFDINRSNAKTQIAFGQGVHHCLGAPLARQELIIGFTAIIERLTNFRLPPGESELKFLPSLLLHGPADLNIEFDKR